MDSAWVGVIGTGVGAAIGGVVTGISLSIQGKQAREARREAADREDRIRAEDRDWNLRQRNSQVHREVYAELLDSAERLVAGLTAQFTKPAASGNADLERLIEGPSHRSWDEAGGEGPPLRWGPPRIS